MVINDWIRGRIPYFRMPPMPNDAESTPAGSKEIKQLFNKIFVTSAFSKEDLKASTEEEGTLVESNPENPVITIESETNSQEESEEENDWDNVFQNVVSTSSTTAEPIIDTLSDADSELELSDQESVVSVSSILPKKKESRMTTNKKKVGVHYYENANVKNKNRSKKRPLNPTEVVNRLKKRNKS